MTTTKISQLTASAGVTDTDLFLTVVSGAGGFVSRKATGAQVSQFVTSSISSLNLTSLSASTISGDGSAITNLTASNVSNFTADVRGQFSAGTGITVSNGQIAAGNIPNSSLTNSSLTVGTTSITLGASATTIQGINTLTASLINGTTANFTSVTASFNGNGSAITNLTASNISNFTNDVRGQFSAGTGITLSNGQISSAGGISSYSASIGNGSATVFALTHSLGKTNIIISVRENPTGAYVYPDIDYISSNIATITFASAPSSDQYFVSILGF